MRTEDVFPLLDRIARELRESGKEGPIELDPEYLRAIAWVESLPENQDGADKCWVEQVFRDMRTHFANVKRKR